MLHRLCKTLIFVIFCVAAFSAHANWYEKAKHMAIEKGLEKLEKSHHQQDTFERLHPAVHWHDQSTVDIDYGFFLVNYDCRRRGYNYVIATATLDKGSKERYEEFSLEPAIEKMGCQNQLTTKPYRSPRGAEAFHRGHGNMSNLWDDSESYMEATNRMVNVVPQHGVQNTSGLWRELEMRVECSRDDVDTIVYVGNLWGDDQTNDYFVDSHGIQTPDYLWRVHVYKNNPNIGYAWIFPNNGNAKPRDDQKYRISLNGLRKNLAREYNAPWPSSLKDGQLDDPYARHHCQQK